MSAALRQQVQQRLTQAQVPRLASKLLALSSQDLAMELLAQASLNPALEYDEPALPPARALERTLTDHLTQQIETMPLETRLRTDALRCLGSLDSRGYLPDQAGLAAENGLAPARTAKALATIRSLHPVGVGARDLADRLLMQLDEMGDGAEVKRARDLVARHFQALSRGRHDLLPKAGLHKALEIIEGLRPSFANEFAPASETLEPDLKASRVRGYWKVRLLDRCGSIWLAEVPDAAGAGAAWRRKVREARALVGAIGFRSNALLVVAQALVDRQRAYFEHGRSRLRPVRLRDLAADTGLSVSTVAATVSNKSITSPAGTVALKYLLQRKVAGGRPTVFSRRAPGSHKKPNICRGHLRPIHGRRDHA